MKRLGTAPELSCPERGSRTPVQPTGSTIREAWRWRGPLIVFQLALREICRPLFYWHVFDIFEIDVVRQGVPQAYAAETVDVAIYPGTGDLEKAKAEIISMRRLQPAEVSSRFDRGDKVAIAYIAGEPTGYAWMSFTSGVVELAFKITWIVGPGEGIRYDTFVLPKMARSKDSQLSAFSHSRRRTRSWDPANVRLDQYFQ